MTASPHNLFYYDQVVTYVASFYNHAFSCSLAPVPMNRAGAFVHTECREFQKLFLTI